MEKWEYCKLKGVGKGGGLEENYYYPELIFFTPEGEKRERLDGKDEITVVAKRIAQLGSDGWEMTGMVPVGQPPSISATHTIYFKRRLEG